MNKKLLTRVCGVAAAGMILAGCAADPALTAPVQTIGGMAPAPMVGIKPTGGRYAFGQEVWAVRRSADGGDAYLVRYAVVAQEGDLVAVIPMFTTDKDQLREALEDAAEMPLDGTGTLHLVQIENCYLDPEEAQAAADRENGEGCCG